MESNSSVYQSFRDHKGEYFSQPHEIEVSFDYKFDEVSYSRDFLDQITHCSQMEHPETSTGESPSLEFKDDCSTEIMRDSVKCTC